MMLKQSTTNVSFPCALLPTWNSKQVTQWEAKGIYFWNWAPEPPGLLSHESLQLNEALQRLQLVMHRLVMHLLPQWTISDHPMRSPETSPWRFRSISWPLIHRTILALWKLAVPKPCTLWSKVWFPSLGTMNTCSWTSLCVGSLSHALEDVSQHLWLLPTKCH